MVIYFYFLHCYIYHYVLLMILINVVVYSVIHVFVAIMKDDYIGCLIK